MASEGARLFGLSKSVWVDEGAYKKEYKVSQLTFEVESEYEDWMLEESLSYARRNVEFLTNYAAIESELVLQGGTGGFSFGSEAWARSAGTRRGYSYLLYLRLRPYHRDITWKEVHSLFLKHRKVFSDAINWLDERTDGPKDALTPTEIDEILSSEESDTPNVESNKNGQPSESTEGSSVPVLES